MKRRHKRKVLKKWVRISIFVSLLFSCFFASFLIYFGVTPQKTASQELFNYNVNNKLDYKVYLNENSLSGEEFSGMNKAYPVKDIDYIDIVYNYNFKGSKDSDLNYTYNIIGTLIIEFENSEYGKQVLSSKEYILKEETSGNYDATKSFGLSDAIKINYNEYNQIVNAYKKEAKYSFTARLDVKMHIKTSGIIDSDTIEDEENKKYLYEEDITVKIPLTETVTMLSTDYKETDSGNVVSEGIIINDDLQLIPISIGAVTLIISLILLLYLSKTVIFVNTKTEYRKEIERILKEYSEIIVEVSSPIEQGDLTFIDIKEFDDMIDLEQEYKSPILYYEKIHGYESWFVIIKDKFMYRYTLKIDK